MKHANISLFVPHMGCPHQCSFCNQKTISGKSRPLCAEEIDEAVKTALSTADCNKGEIAFFGGSFTAIDKEYMTALLERAKKYIDKGLFAGIRISTRLTRLNFLCSDEFSFISSRFLPLSISFNCFLLRRLVSLSFEL